MNKLAQIFKIKMAILFLLTIGCADVRSNKYAANHPTELKAESNQVAAQESTALVCPTADVTSLNYEPILQEANFHFLKEKVITKKLNCKSEIVRIIEEVVSITPNFEIDLAENSGLKKIGLVVANNRANCSKVEVYNKSLFKEDNIIVGVIPANDSILLKTPGVNFIDYVVYDINCSNELYTEDPKNCDDKILSYGTLRVQTTFVESIQEKIVFEKICH